MNTPEQEFHFSKLYFDDGNYHLAFVAAARASSNGHPEATNALAYYYQYGYGVDPDQEKATELYQNASDLGSVVGKYNLGINLIGNNHYGKAIKILEESSLSGYAPSTHRLVEFYFFKDDRKNALKYAQRYIYQNPIVGALSYVGVFVFTGW